jgi:hypothetical protein
MKYFTLDEFDSPDHKGSGVNMDSNFLELLNNARQIAGIPFKISSGYRTIEHNQKVGGVSNSSHLSGLAADISISSGNERYLVLNALIKAGFKGWESLKPLYIAIPTDQSQTRYGHTNTVGSTLWKN